jgi:hypothetical protein
MAGLKTASSLLHYWLLTVLLLACLRPVFPEDAMNEEDNTETKGFAVANAPLEAAEAPPIPAQNETLSNAERIQEKEKDKTSKEEKQDSAPATALPIPVLLQEPATVSSTLSLLKAAATAVYHIFNIYC